MPNRMTAVPDRAVPRLGAAVDRVVPLADLFMLLMVSRPRTGSLRNTWVTPATLWLCLAVVPIGVAAAVALFAAGGTARVAGGAAVAVLTAGAAAVAAVGIAQRRAT